VTQKDNSWFHCARCGSLFQSPFGINNDRICGVCGQKPSLGNLITKADASPAPLPSAKGTKNPDRENYAKRPGQSNYLILKIAAGWILFLAVILVAARLIWSDATPESAKKIENIDNKDVVSDEDTALLTKAQSLCNESFSKLLQAAAPEEQNQFVLNAISTGPRIARFYSMNPSPTMDPGKMTLARNAVVQLPSGRAIETQWTTSDGHSLDAVFSEENGEWTGSTTRGSAISHGRFSSQAAAKKSRNSACSLANASPKNAKMPTPSASPFTHHASATRAIRDSNLLNFSSNAPARMDNLSKMPWTSTNKENNLSA
jgi:hypothetical protein